MRLKEPLQGVIMCQGHNIIHWTFFIAMCLFLRDDPAPNHVRDETDDHFNEREHIYYNVSKSIQLLKWGHLLNAIVQIVCMILKK